MHCTVLRSSTEFHRIVWGLKAGLGVRGGGDSGGLAQSGSHASALSLGLTRNYVTALSQLQFKKREGGIGTTKQWQSRETERGVRGGMSWPADSVSCEVMGILAWRPIKCFDGKAAPFLSLSLSLTHTHTHTRTHERTHAPE